MKLEFVKLNPSENMTILVKNFDDKSKFIEVSNKLLSYGNVFAEQVGFITNPTSDKAVSRLDMMGGEFCGNATMCLASLYARDNHFEPEKESDIPLEVSGAEGIVDCYITPQDDYFIGRVKISAPHKIEEIKADIGTETIPAKLIHLNGITHMCLEDDGTLDKELISSLFIRNYSTYTNQDALGILFYNSQEGFMYPVVYVESIDQAIHERCCGSGSAAIATALSHQGKLSQTLKINQPGGYLDVSVEYDNGKLKEIWIKGKVSIVAEGFAYI